MRVCVAAMAVCALLLASPVAEASSKTVRAMWLWRTPDLFSPGAIEGFIETAEATRLTDVYLFLRADDYTASETELRVLLAALAAAGVRAWGMEGWRGYFSDVDGPGDLYRAADALVAFNARNPVGFAGFHSDIEPHDGQGEGLRRFHDGIRASRLTARQGAQRDRLMTEWLTMHHVLAGKMRYAGLLYGAALPSWADDYYGEPIEATFRGERLLLVEHLSAMTAQYVIMSYGTRVEAVLERVAGEMTYAEAARRRQIMFSLETHAGPGVGVSYADTPPKNRRAAVLADLDAIERRLRSRFPSAYLGWAIHDYEGWAALTP